WFEGESPLDTGPVAVTLDPSSLRRDLRPFTVTLEAGGSERKFVEDLVKYWLEIGDVGLQFTWPDSGEPEFRIAGGTFGLIAFQLMAMLTRSQDIATCSGCGQPYLRQGRRPKFGQRNYCPDCGVRVANRDRQRALAARRRAQHGG